MRSYNQPFSGSYRPEDALFLLKQVDIKPTDVRTKEAAIQSGKAHYSEMLSPEKTPDQRYMRLFYEALAQNEVRFAEHIASLARTLAARADREVVLVSLARAGTPVGVLLVRALRFLGVPSTHYSISIIRDRGIDAVALDYIVDRGHRSQDAVMIDGWTGKGAISSELRKSVAEYNASRGTKYDTELAVVADLAGVADLASTADDYLIPSAILNSTVSGLVSRTVLNSMYVGEGDFHACAFYADKLSIDISNAFVDRITPHVLAALADVRRSPLCNWGPALREGLKRTSDEFVAWAMERYGLTDRNRVKPGIGESTRALLRRVPDRLIVRDPHAVDVQHLISLATAGGDEQVALEVNPSLPYRAAVIIKTLGE